MSRLFIFTITLTSLTFLSCQKEPTQTVATAMIHGYAHDVGEIGAFHAVYKDGITYATITLDNVPGDRSFAVHIHEGTCDNVLGHWNQGGDSNFCEVEDMGTTWGKPYAGDVENVYVNETGRGSYLLSTKLWSVGTGDETDILGKVIIVHEFPTDFMAECDPNHTGGHTHPNLKIACGTITSQ